MIRILQLSKRYSGDYPLFNEMSRLDDTRFENVVCYLSGHNDGSNALEKTSKTYYLERNSSHLRWYNFPLIRKIAEIIDRDAIQVVNCQLHRTTPIGVCASLLARQKPLVLSTIHGIGSSTGWGRQLQYRLMNPYLYRTVAISHAVADDIHTTNPWLAPGKVITVQNGLNFERFLVDDDRMTLRRKLFPEVKANYWFGTAGRLSAVKDHATLLHAFREVVDQTPDVVLMIAGRGELETSLKHLVETLGLQSHVKFLGFRSDIPQVLHTLDFFVFPSLREGLPLALLEAMAAKLPVIASRVGGIPEVFGEDPMGQLISPHNVEELSAAMYNMATTPPSHLRKLGENARRRALGQFDARRMVREYEELYTECGDVWAKRDAR